MDSLRPILAGLAAAGIAVLLMRAGRKPSPREEGRHHIRYGAAPRLLALGLLLISPVFAYVALRARPGEVLVAIGITAFVFGFALFFAYQTFFVELSYDRSYLYYHSPWAGSYQIPWHDVRAVRWSRLLQCHYIETAQVHRIWLSQMCAGHDDLVRLINRKHS